ncbi:MAG: sulfite exporter TauE/SafE family protein [Gemmataceae bacterium]|nr:sulfite exporter TauE/SafE family protein [Gemmataceae bacterium]
MEQWEVYTVLCLAAFGAGVINSIAGGGTLLTFPALSAVTDPALANATSTLALLPGSYAGALGYRRELWNCRHFALRMLPPSLLGGGIGAWLVAIAPGIFSALVPWLILLAAILFMIQGPLYRWVKKHYGEHTSSKLNYASSKVKYILAAIIQFLISLYGGYFGAGIGILMLSVLGFMNIGNIHFMNAVKTFLAAVINTASILIFVCNDMIVWNYAIPMILTAMAGGYTGASVARKLPSQFVRYIVIIIAFMLSLYYFII